MERRQQWPCNLPLLKALPHLVVFSGQVLSFARFCICVVFSVPEHSKEVGDVFKCIGDVVGMEFAYGNGYNHWKIYKFRTFGDFIIVGVLLPSLPGKYMSEQKKNASKTKKQRLKTL